MSAIVITGTVTQTGNQVTTNRAAPHEHHHRRVLHAILAEPGRGAIFEPLGTRCSCRRKLWPGVPGSCRVRGLVQGLAWRARIWARYEELGRTYFDAGRSATFCEWDFECLYEGKSGGWLGASLYLLRDSLKAELHEYKTEREQYRPYKAPL